MTNEASNKTPGSILREARESMSLSLAEVAAMTRIPRTMLSHLERDRFDEYAAEVFARGHLRNYARELKLDPERVIQAYERYTGRVRSSSSESQASEEQSKDTRSVGKAARSFSKARKKASGGWSAHFDKLTSSVRTSHVVAIGLVLVFLFVMVQFLTGSRATAKDPAQFPEASEQEWEIEEAADEARWALEQPAEESSADDDSDE
ncbi:MAG: helix-turn-helix domain-containing protein [Myxococcota bacterium]